MTDGNNVFQLFRMSRYRTSGRKQTSKAIAATDVSTCTMPTITGRHGAAIAHGMSSPRHRSWWIDCSCYKSMSLHPQTTSSNLSFHSPAPTPECHSPISLLYYVICLFVTLLIDLPPYISNADQILQARLMQPGLLHLKVTGTCC